MSIADKLTYLNTTKQLLKTEINKINNVLTDESTFRSYPQELFNGYLDILNNGTDTLWNNLEKVSQTGTEAVLEGVETAPIKMVLNGNTSQDGEPTPDTPVDVQVVKGENVVSVSGKNLFDAFIYPLTDENGTIVLTNATSSEIGYLSTGRKLKEFCPSLKVGDVVYLYIESDWEPRKYIYTSHLGIWGNTYAKTITEEALNDTLVIYGGYQTTSHITIMITKERDNVFVPYSKTDYPINLGDIELCEINTYKDYFHKDSGKWYVHKEINKIILDGTNVKFTYQEQSSLPNRLMIPASSRPRGLESSNLVKTTHFKVVENTVPNTTGLGWYTSTQMWIYKDGFTSLAVGNNWLSNNNVTLYYVLVTPTEEEITNTTLIEQLEAISKAKSVKDKTYITQTNDELPFILDVEAIKEYEVN